MPTKHKIDCEECKSWTDAYLDNELDTATASLLNAHIEQCAVCAARYHEAAVFTVALRRNVPRYRPPGALAAKVAEDTTHTRRGDRQLTRRDGWFRWVLPGFSTAAMAMAISLYIAAPGGSGRLADEVVSSHVRSLMEHHLTDVESSDKHTVKPWFTGRLDYSPPVTDFAPDGYPLVGGRLDYLGHRTVSALAYRHGKHLVNVFILPDDSRDRVLGTQTLRGYNIASWTRDHTMFYVISDMRMQELIHFSQLVFKED